MITETELRNKLIRLCGETSQSQVATKLKITRGYVSDLVAGKRRISNTIAKYFGYRAVPIKIPVERQYQEIKKK